MGGGQYKKTPVSGHEMVIQSLVNLEKRGIQATFAAIEQYISLNYLIDMNLCSKAIRDYIMRGSDSGEVQATFKFVGNFGVYNNGYPAYRQRPPYTKLVQIHKHNNKTMSQHNLQQLLRSYKDLSYVILELIRLFQQNEHRWFDPKHTERACFDEQELKRHSRQKHHNARLQDQERERKFRRASLAEDVRRAEKKYYERLHEQDQGIQARRVRLAEDVRKTGKEYYDRLHGVEQQRQARQSSLAQDVRQAGKEHYEGLEEQERRPGKALLYEQTPRDRRVRPDQQGHEGRISPHHHLPVRDHKYIEFQIIRKRYLESDRQQREALQQEREAKLREQREVRNRQESGECLEQQESIKQHAAEDVQQWQETMEREHSPIKRSLSNYIEEMEDGDIEHVKKLRRASPSSRYQPHNGYRTLCPTRTSETDAEAKVLKQRF